MNITKTTESGIMKVTLEGSLDTLTAPALDNELGGVYGIVNELIFDFSALDYVSSAGLRTLLNAQKQMNMNGGTFIIRNVNSDVMDIFEITGFSDIITIE